jgi:hypothetical protein
MDEGDSVQDGGRLSQRQRKKKGCPDIRVGDRRSGIEELIAWRWKRYW